MKYFSILLHACLIQGPENPAASLGYMSVSLHTRVGTRIDIPNVADQCLRVFLGVQSPAGL